MKKEEIKKYLLYAFGAFVLYYLWRGWQSGSKLVMGAAEIEALSESSNVSKERILVCKDVAEKVEKAIWNNHKTFGFLPINSWRIDEDEEAVIKNLNRLNTVEEANLTSQYYREFSRGKSLFSDVRKYLSAGEQGQIKPTISSALE